MTLKSLPIDSEFCQAFVSPFQSDAIPASLNYPHTVSYSTQVITMQTITDRPLSVSKKEAFTSPGKVNSVRSTLHLKTSTPVAHTKPKVKDVTLAVQTKPKVENVTPAVQSKPKLEDVGKRLSSKRETTPSSSLIEKSWDVDDGLMVSPKPKVRAVHASNPTTNQSIRPKETTPHKTSATRTPLLEPSKDPVPRRSASIRSNDQVEEETAKETFDFKKKMKGSLSNEFADNGILLVEEKLDTEPIELEDDLYNTPKIREANNEVPQEGRYSPATQLENEYQEFLKRSQANDLADKVLRNSIQSEVIPEIQEEIEGLEGEAASAIPEEIGVYEEVDCEKDIEKENSTQVKFLRFTISTDTKPKEMDSADRKVITSATGARLEQRLKFNNQSSKSIAPAAEDSVQDGIGSWEQSTSKNDLARYVSNSEREKYSVPIEDDDFDDDSFYIYDEMGVKKEYHLEAPNTQ